MRLPIYQVDAFADRLFDGNPAAVVPLESWLPDATMLAIAAENNLAETAFFVPDGDGYALRWFTPKLEVPLCGHATLASAFVILTLLDPGLGRVRFATKSGDLRVSRAGELFALDFPSRSLEPVDAAEATAVGKALGGEPVSVQRSADRHMVLYEDAASVQALKPDLRALLATRTGRAIATAPGTDCDFVSRYFAPGAGIDEDPVTGSSHCTLVPYWAARLGKKKLLARQIGPRRHAPLRTCRRTYDHGGGAKLYLEGTIHV